MSVNVMVTEKIVHMATNLSFETSQALCGFAWIADSEGIAVASTSNVKRNA